MTASTEKLADKLLSLPCEEAFGKVTFYFHHEARQDLKRAVNFYEECSVDIGKEYIKGIFSVIRIAIKFIFVIYIGISVWSCQSLPKRVIDSDPFANPYHGKEVKLDLGDGVQLAMIYIDGGSFLMGSETNRPARGHGDEIPVHLVELDGFWIGKYPVTQMQYQAIMGTNPSRKKIGSCPVDNVSWNDAMDFCRKLSDRTGKSFTLPTEAQWEYACRAGTDTWYYFGDDVTRLAEYAWYRDYYLRHETEPVGRKKPNAWGLYDMHGNVWEWCLDDWYDNYNGLPVNGSRRGDGSGTGRAMRGGSADSMAWECRSASRRGRTQFMRWRNTGFRIVAN